MLVQKQNSSSVLGSWQLPTIVPAMPSSESSTALARCHPAQRCGSCSHYAVGERIDGGHVTTRVHPGRQFTGEIPLDIGGLQLQGFN